SMFRRLAWLAALVLALMLSGGGLARADEPFRIVISHVDAGDFPKVRLVASVVDARGRAVPGLRPQDLQLREGNATPQASVTLASMVSPLRFPLVAAPTGALPG